MLQTLNLRRWRFARRHRYVFDKFKDRSRTVFEKNIVNLVVVTIYELFRNHMCRKRSFDVRILRRYFLQINRRRTIANPNILQLRNQSSIGDTINLQQSVASRSS